MVCLIFIVCDNDDEELMMIEDIFYQKLGGIMMVIDFVGGMIEQGWFGLCLVVDSFIFVIVVDLVLSFYFVLLLVEVGNGNIINFVILSENLIDFFCVVIGVENYIYDGMDMVSVYDLV